MEVLTLFIKLILSALFAGILGYEREISQKPAGLRTLMLVGVGSCLFMLISIEAAEGNTKADPTRIAAQVVTGIGFLGAGAIIRAGGSVIGLTTAASIWLVAAIGLAVGAGMYLTAVIATILGFVILLVVERWFEERIGSKGRGKRKGDF